MNWYGTPLSENLRQTSLKFPISCARDGNGGLGGRKLSTDRYARRSMLTHCSGSASIWSSISFSNSLEKVCNPFVRVILNNTLASTRTSCKVSSFVARDDPGRGYHQGKEGLLKPKKSNRTWKAGKRMSDDNVPAHLLGHGCTLRPSVGGLMHKNQNSVTALQDKWAIE